MLDPIAFALARRRVAEQFSTEQAPPTPQGPLDTTPRVRNRLAGALRALADRLEVTPAR